jgi:hypothetical protein
MKRKFIILTLTTLFLSGCFGLFDSSSDRIIGNYIVLWIDLPESQTVSVQDEMNSSSSTPIVPEYVFAVGHNADYIIAKQHPTSGFKEGFKIDTRITNYYIVKMNTKEQTNEEKVIGPLTLNKFDSLRKELRIEHLEFDQNYPDKP